jgi:hypothetical protein
MAPSRSPGAVSAARSPAAAARCAWGWRPSQVEVRLPEHGPAALRADALAAGRGMDGRAAPAARRALRQRSWHPLLDQLAPEVEQARVGDPRWAGGLAGPAGQAAIEVDAGRRGDLLALEQLLDQVDATARAVEFAAEQLVGGAGGEAEAAVDAVAQDAFDGLHRGLGTELAGDRGLHGVVRARRRADPGSGCHAGRAPP